MKITYLGSGAAEGVPAMFCNCHTCLTAKKIGGKEIRTRTQVLIDEGLCIDFPPDAYGHAMRFQVDLSAIEHLLITHSHMDHFYAHDFILRGYKYAAGITSSTLRIYGNDEVKKVFAECTRRELRADVAQTISFVRLQPLQEYAVGEYTVTAFPAEHSIYEEALLFLVEREGKGYLHLHDTGMPPMSLFNTLKERGKKVDLVSLDCTFIDAPGPHSNRHMSLEQNLSVMQKMREDGVADQNTKFVITHFSHNSAPFTHRLRGLEEKYGVIAAYDGMHVEI